MLNKNASSSLNNIPFNLLNMTLQERLEYALKRAQMSQSGLAAAVGLTRGAVSLWLTGQTKQLDGTNLVKAAKALGIDPHWLGTGEGPAPNPRIREAAFTEYLPDQASELVTRVPVITWSQAARWLDIVNNLKIQDVAQWLPCPVEHSDLTFILRVRGESMTNPHGRPSFEDGDLIYVDPARQPEHRSCVVVRLAGAEEASFKQLVIEGPKRYLKALNPAWPEPMIEIGADVTLCGVVIFRGEKV